METARSEGGVVNRSRLDAYKWAEKQLGDVLKEGMVKDLKKKLASQGIGSQAYSDGGEGIGIKGWMRPNGKVHQMFQYVVNMRITFLHI